MRYLSAGTDPTTARISRIGLGAWQFGSAEWGYGQAYAEQEERWLRVNDELLTWQLGAERRGGAAPN